MFKIYFKHALSSQVRMIMTHQIGFLIVNSVVTSLKKRRKGNLVLLFLALTFFSLGSLLAQGQGKTKAVAEKKKYVLVIDPGHGGKDPGKPRGTKKYLNEKDLNLAIALKLGAYITENLDSVEVLYTRTDDQTISLDEIVDFANNAKADYFISIHCNSSPHKSVYGTNTHIQSHSFKTSRKLAMNIEKEFRTRAGRRSRGVIDRAYRGYNYQVLQYTEMPGVLVECGFMSNVKEEKYLNSTYGQEIIASAIYRGFRGFLGMPKEPEDHKTYYKIQLYASTQSEAKRLAGYRKKLGMRVDEHEWKGKKYKYTYTVGREYEYRFAKELRDKVRKKGFKDAYIVEFKD